MSSKPFVVGILEAGLGASSHLRHAIVSMGYETRMITSPVDIDKSNLVIFTGTGHVGSVIQELHDCSLFGALQQYILNDRPYLGIASGMHILFDSSDDHSEVSLLSALPGTISKLESWDVSVPHIGWNGITRADHGASISGAISSEVESVYFAHSYCVTPGPENMEFIESITDYGDQRYISMICKGNVAGVQFQPERSGEVGLAFLKDFVTKFSEDALTTISGQAECSIEDFGQLQALPCTRHACRVVVVADSLACAVQQYVDGADEVLITLPSSNGNVPLDSGVLGVEGLFVPCSVHYPAGIDLVTATQHQKAGIDRIVIDAAEVVRLAISFLTTGILSGESVIERMASRYGPHSVVAVIDAERILIENPMKPFKRPDNVVTSADGAESHPDPADDLDDEAFPTLTAARDAGKIPAATASGADDGSGMVQIIAETDDEHEMLAMLRGMGRTVVHLQEEQALLQDDMETQEEADGQKTDKATLGDGVYLSHCWFSVPVPVTTDYSAEGSAAAARCIDAVVLAKVCEVLGAGEILLRGGGAHSRSFDCALINAVQNAVSISVLAAPTTGIPAALDDYSEVFERTRVKAVLLDTDGPQVLDLKSSLRTNGTLLR